MLEYKTGLPLSNMCLLFLEVLDGGGGELITFKTRGFWYILLEDTTLAEVGLRHPAISNLHLYCWFLLAKPWGSSQGGWGCRALLLRRVHAGSGQGLAPTD